MRSSQLRAFRTLLIATAVAGTGLLAPFLKGGVLIGLAIVGSLAVWLAFRGAGEPLTAFLVDRSPWAGVAVVCLGVVVSVFGALEHGTRGLRELRLIEPYRPMETLLPPGTEDWRAAHITADDHREWDPVLWWKPIARYPYNRQGFKGPEVPGGVGETFRIMCYGDSNTDGPDRGGWTERLHTLLRERHGSGIEVVNAGVAGYSSHQGLRRFEQDAAVFQPDLVFVSFGWNDLATTSQPPDSAYMPPSAVVARLQGFLLKYTFYLTLMNRQRANPQAPDAIRSRVSLEEYLANLEGFRAVADRIGARLVVLTRPHRDSPDHMRGMEGNWRARVPDYNDALREWSRHSPGVGLIDVQAHFQSLDHSFFIDECHFTPRGHQRMAELLERSLMENGWLSATAATASGAADSRHRGRSGESVLR